MLDFESFCRKYQKALVEKYPNRVLEAVPEPVVAVQVSTYQHADFIRDCLEGILMQETDFPVEILIGEDESSDGTREICKEYADRHPDTIRLFLHRREDSVKIHGRPTGKFQSVYTRFMRQSSFMRRRSTRWRVKRSALGGTGTRRSRRSATCPIAARPSPTT